mmetsp:Transcript_71952/g.191926  ORF Transcript_71952/g.191926 Transcript_71952/m.191926 type:complete len:115 (-) Transcript_71952:142-486(-)
MPRALAATFAPSTGAAALARVGEEVLLSEARTAEARLRRGGPLDRAGRNGDAGPAPAAATAALEGLVAGKGTASTAESRACDLSGWRLRLACGARTATVSARAWLAGGTASGES